MKILGIETSCDETSVALLDVRDRMLLRRHAVSSQIRTHAKYGGVVPEVAARMHLETLQPLLAMTVGKKALGSVDLIAVTKGPGLITSLMVGVQAAKTLAYFLKKPLVGVNHLEGHIYATWLTSLELHRNPRRYFPALVLIASGGHTELIMMRTHGSYKLLGETQDDAAGEAFDKVAKVLGLGYPGGPAIAQLARSGDPAAIDFPRPMLASADYNVSFSGLKTAVLYYLEKKKTVRRSELPDVAASFQQAVVDVLIAKLTRAGKQFAPRSLIIGGGVSANALLRDECAKLGSRWGIPVFLPALEFTGDNAAMIAAAGYFRRHEATKTAWRTLAFDPHLRFV